MLKNIMKYAPNPRRIIVIFGFGLGLFLTACADQPPRQPPAPVAVPSVTINYLQTPAGPVLDVAAVNMLPLTEAALVAPDGSAMLATNISRDVMNSGGYYSPAPSVGIGGFGGSGGGGGVGLGLGFPLGGGGYSQPSGLAPITSHTQIPIGNIDNYRRDWQKSVVRMRYGSQPGQVLVGEVKAPPPP